jgi:hypothetical protein
MRVRLRPNRTPSPPQTPGRSRRGARTDAHPRPKTEPPTVERPAGADATDRARRSGGPQDRALYVCRCGSAFQAPVTASVRCPHCGESQAW